MLLHRFRLVTAAQSRRAAAYDPENAVGLTLAHARCSDVLVELGRVGVALNLVYTP